MNRLKEIRKQNNMTQKQVADLLGIEQQSYARCESVDIKTLSLTRLNELALIFNTNIEYLLETNTDKNSKGIKIPVLGTIPAGIPIEMVEDIIDYEEIDTELAKTGNFFGLKVKGNSMEPRILNNDVVIVRKQENAESGDVCVVMVNGFDATLKQIKKDINGITLIPFNKEYKEIHYTNEQIRDLPIKIIGKVVELRGKF